MDNDSRVSTDRVAVDVSLLVVRIAAGVIMAAHGAQKLFGVWGGNGLEATVAPPPDGMGILGYPVAIGEFFGGLGMALGFLSRFSAAANIVIMIGAIAMVHGQNGFFLSKGGCEYNLALIGLMVPILLCGPGRYSVGDLLPLPKSQKTGRTISILE